jgi:hypothetical protein
MNNFHSKNRSRVMGAILGMAALMIIFGFGGGAYASRSPA